MPQGWNHEALEIVGGGIIAAIESRPSPYRTGKRVRRTGRGSVFNLRIGPGRPGPG